MSIVTKTGDEGETSLMYGRRLPKNNPRSEAYGTVDELTAALGLARASCDDKFVAEQILAVQKDLINVMGELANGRSTNGLAYATVTVIIGLNLLLIYQSVGGSF